MGRSIAQVFAVAGEEVTLVDSKARSQMAFESYQAQVRAEIEANMRLMSSLDALDGAQVLPALNRVRVETAETASHALATAEIVIECVPEIMDAKAGALALIGRAARPDAMVMSTLAVGELQSLLVSPERFLNAHFLNPAFLIPLIELSPGERTDRAVLDAAFSMFEAIGKVPVVCRPSPGYIVPRLQALLMSEACRIVAEGVASVEDVDKAVAYGFGPRYAAMGIFEFIDWGGLDILFYGGHFLAKALDSPAHAPPDEVARMMAEGRDGMRSGRGYYDFRNVDVAEFQRTRLKRLLQILRLQENIVTPRSTS
jgi:3-hydroxybutyryl-CoA dehydrogenase